MAEILYNQGISGVSSMGAEQQMIIGALTYFLKALETNGYNIPVSPGVGASQAQVTAAVDATVLATNVTAILAALVAIEAQLAKLTFDTANSLKTITGL